MENQSSTEAVEAAATEQTEGTVSTVLEAVEAAYSEDVEETVGDLLPTQVAVPALDMGLAEAEGDS